ncbi:MAG: SMI1/KNR4 family protein [Deltaproteobacteria bacterium]|nr:SMI1/KNR4 family protein [Deltaproteobacteria bacterium]
MTLLIDRLLRKWNEIGLEVRAGAPVATLDDFEQRNRVILPPAMRALYMTADGMDDSGQELDIVRNIRFWPLSEIRLVSDADVHSPLNYRNVFVFADYFYRSHFYGVSMADPQHEQVLLVADDKPLVIAASFSDFVQLYIDHPEYLCGGRQAN